MSSCVMCVRVVNTFPVRREGGARAVRMLDWCGSGMEIYIPLLAL